MQVVQGRNVNTVWIDGLWRLKLSGLVEESRVGRVKVLPEPLTSVYEKPWERVLFHPTRDANPFFHLIEALWMLAGSEDLAFLEVYNTRMAEFSDDKVILNGAYGFRWRQLFERDQLLDIVAMLRADRTTRRAVLEMWDPMMDLDSKSKDIPCNTHAYFRVRDGLLDMTVCCRSNDAVWGAYGANAVHFSILHEFIARSCSLTQGRMYQVSNNFHIYERHWPLLEVPVVLKNYYHNSPEIVWPLFEDHTEAEFFLLDCERMVWLKRDFATDFFNRIVHPAITAWALYKNGKLLQALDALAVMPVCDWHFAMEEWLERRAK